MPWSIIILAGCAHSAVDYPAAPTAGPFNTGSDIHLTLNAEQDYWPAWTADGRGILYSFIDSVPGAQHRCVGLLPAAGGTRVWQLCDNRAIESDSVNSFGGYAVDAAGHLLYTEAESTRGPTSLAPGATTLWLADTASPFERRMLLRLPVQLAGRSLDWLADIEWRGPDEFTALAQEFTASADCKACPVFDSVFNGIGVIRGTISAAGASIALIAGTENASSYSFAENGTVIAFTQMGDPHLFKVDASGGAPTIATLVSGDTLLGVSCFATTCIVAADPIVLDLGNNQVVLKATVANPAQLLAVDLATGGVQTVLTDPSRLLATPKVSPAGHDAVLQRGGLMGHWRTDLLSASDLDLFLGLLP